MTVLVFANGDMNNLDWVRPYLDAADVVVAADGGARHVRALGRVPTCVIGDLDSLEAAEVATLAGAGVEVMRYSREKDETDLELALVHAAARSAGDIFVFGVLGGRLDQTLANILLLAHPALYGRAVYLMEEFQRAWLVRQAAVIEGEIGDTVSLIPLGGDAKVAVTTGLKWSLAEDVLAFGPARGVSNVMTEAAATVRLHSGQVLCIHTRQEWGR